MEGIVAVNSGKYKSDIDHFYRGCLDIQQHTICMFLKVTGDLFVEADTGHFLVLFGLPDPACCATRFVKS